MFKACKFKINHLKMVYEMQTCLHAYTCTYIQTYIVTIAQQTHFNYFSTSATFGVSSHSFLKCVLNIFQGDHALFHICVTYRTCH